MKKSLIIILVCFSAYTYGQNSQLSLMQGNWQGANMEGETIFKIVKGNKCLEFTLAPKPGEVDFTLFELIIGFQNQIASSSYDSLYLKFNSLEANGLYYTEILNNIYIGEDGVVVKPNFLIPSYYECDGNVLSINGGKLFEFEKIEKVPFEALKKLYLKGKLNKRDYLKDYLDLKALTIISKRCTVYSEPGRLSQTQLGSDDIVIVIEDIGKWLKVRYAETSIGWIRKNDAK